MDTVSAATTRQLRRELTEALNRLYMGDCKFLPVFDETPLAALAAFEKAPDVFGVLRTYVGRSLLQANKKRVLKLARRLSATPPQQIADASEGNDFL